MRLVKLIGTLIPICILVFIMYLSFFNVKLISGKKENITKVIIDTCNNNHNNIKSVSIEDKKAIYEIFELIQNTKN